MSRWSKVSRSSDGWNVEVQLGNQHIPIQREESATPPLFTYEATEFRHSPRQWSVSSALGAARFMPLVSDQGRASS
ncbi:hypothetical protein JTE90_014976 [Oedothorax gibbosus]|uniref:Uncharacterized protein n=1 Tax=Oedothorax gibbosus TaxID=931172 RepID=A0AAV6UXR8_9ARAC|nr:hypothetical protein JTE90_014976 [Oedothorax gibbosus]